MVRRAPRVRRKRPSNSSLQRTRLRSPLNSISLGVETHMLPGIHNSKRATAGWFGAFVLLPLAVWAISAYQVDRKSLSNWVLEPFGIVTLSVLALVAWLFAAGRSHGTGSARVGVVLVVALSVLAFAVCLAVPGLPE